MELLEFMKNKGHDWLDDMAIDCFEETRGNMDHFDRICQRYLREIETPLYRKYFLVMVNMQFLICELGKRVDM